MRTQRELITSVLSGLAMAAVVAMLVTLPPVDAHAAQRGAGEPPAPCGPAGDLSAELATNVAADSRCFELRMYTADPSRDGVGNFSGGINELHQRFREKEVELFEKHGAEWFVESADLISINNQPMNWNDIR